MSIILRHALSSFCYGDWGTWVNDPEHALDLGTIERAVEAARNEDFGGLEIVMSFGEPDCDLVLPLRWAGTSNGNAPPARSQAPVSPLPPNLAGVRTPFPPPFHALGLI
jgi:hypothetical protein